MVKLKIKKMIRNGGLVVSVCDEKYVGKIFEEGNKQLDLSSDFFEGEDSSPEEIKDILDKTNNATIVGEESIKVVQEEYPDINVIKIDGVPFTTICRL